MLEYEADATRQCRACRDVTWRARWKLGLCECVSRCNLLMMRFSGRLIVFIFGFNCVLKNKMWWWWWWWWLCSVDVNECARCNGHCHRLATCYNTLGSYRCVCRNGTTGTGFQCKGLSHLQHVSCNNGNDNICIHLSNACNLNKLKKMELNKE